MEVGENGMKLKTHVQKHVEPKGTYTGHGNVITHLHLMGENLAMGRITQFKTVLSNPVPVSKSKGNTVKPHSG